MGETNTLFDLLLNSVFPNKITCVSCDDELRTDRERVENLCSSCKESFVYLGQKKQQITNKDLYIDDYYAAYMYKDKVRSLVISFKDGNKPYIGEFIAESLESVIKQNKITAEGICYVPSSKKKRRQRGYDHMEIVATRLAKQIDLEVIRVIARHNIGVDQTETEDRYKNIQGQYYYVNGQNIKDRNLILIDDVVTTGATVSQCSRILKENGANRVLLIAFTEAKSFDSYKNETVKRMLKRK